MRGKFKIKNRIFTPFLSLMLLATLLVPTAFVFAKPKVISVSLEKGVLKDIEIPNAPTNFTRGGEYRKLVQIRYNPSTKVLRFIPKQVGIGTLIIKDQNEKVIYEVRIDVKQTDLFKIAREIKRLTSDIEGINIKTLNNKVIVDGEILLPKDMNRIHSVVKQYGDKATNLVTLSPMAQAKIAQFIEREINNPEIQVKAVNGKFIIQGTCRDEREMQRAEIIAKAYAPDVVVDEAVADKKTQQRRADIVINLCEVRQGAAPEPKKIIELIVHYVELQKDYQKGFRFQWTPDIGDGTQVDFSTGGRSPGGAVATISGTIRNLLPKLNWAKEHGHARVLNSSSLIVQDGNEGILNSLSRIPYQVVNAQGQPSTSFEEVGIRTNITPQIIGSRSDSVSLNLNFAIKSLISQTAAGPLTSSREIKTSIVVRSRQSAAVGGLITNDTGTAYNKLPEDASRNPLISLYASKSFRRNQSQFVVFVTPVIKASASAGAEKVKQKFRLKD
ncbi:MAG: BON domain-containing protein [Bdellovibrionaceae bacterium]|nr:BON domain-containing protein [Pseudobdellovibrionaceae bacterium]